MDAACRFFHQIEAGLEAPTEYMDDIGRALTRGSTTGINFVVLPHWCRSMVENRKEDRTARYRGRQKAEGLRKVCVWVPEKLAGEVKAYAAKLRKKAGK